MTIKECMEAGDYVYLTHEVIEPATGDHPMLLMGRKGERVRIVDKFNQGEYPFLVEGPTNPGKPWFANSKDLTWTKPIG